VPGSSDTDHRDGAGTPRRRTHGLLFAAIVVGWLVVDQLTKSWAESELRFEDIDVVWTLRLNLAYNTGASFGFGGGYGTWFSLFGLVVVGLLVWQGARVRSRLAALALGMIVAGVLGNIADRALRGDDGFMSGAVVDFVDLRWWPIFNVADVGIVCGGLLLVATVFLGGLDDDPDGPDDAGQRAQPLLDREANPPGSDRSGGGTTGSAPG
jgi:signal peptidase II